MESKGKSEVAALKAHLALNVSRKASTSTAGFVILASDPTSGASTFLGVRISGWFIQ